MHKLALALAAHRHKYQHHVLHGQRDGAAQDVFERFLVPLHAQLLQQHFHDVAVAGVAHRFVVQRLHPALERFAQGAQAARGVEGFVLGAVEREMLQPFKRQHFDDGAVADGLARVAVFVDEAVHTPGQVVLE